MKKFLLLALLIPILVFGQNEIKEEAKLTVSEGYPTNYKSFHQKYLLVGNTVYMIKFYKKNYVLQVYDKTSKKIISSKEIPAFGKEQYIVDFVNVKDQACLFYSKWDGKKKAEQFYVKKIDKQTSSFDNGQLLFEHSGKIAGIYGIYAKSILKTIQKNNLYFSSDSSKILIQSRSIPQSRDDKVNKDIINISVFDANFNLLRQESVKMPYPEVKMNNLTYSIDKQGNVFLLAKVFNSDKAVDDIGGELNYHLELMKLKQDEVEIYKIGEDKFYYTQSVLQENAIGDMTLTCLYNDHYKKHYTKGYMFQSLSLNNTLSKVNTMTLPKVLYKQNEEDEAQKDVDKADSKGEDYIKDLKILAIKTMEEGGVLIISEINTIQPVQSNITVGMPAVGLYTDMYLVRLDKDGRLIWMKKIPKEQGGVIGTPSFLYSYKNDQYSFYMLNNKENLSLKDNEKAKVAHADYSFTLHKLDDKSGKMSAYLLIDDIRILNIDKTNLYLNHYDHFLSRAVITNTGIIYEVRKKEVKEDVMIHVDFE